MAKKKQETETDISIEDSEKTLETVDIIDISVEAEAEAEAEIETELPKVEFVQPKDTYKWVLIGGKHSFKRDDGEIVTLEKGDTIDIKASCNDELPAWAKNKFVLAIG